MTCYKEFQEEDLNVFLAGTSLHFEVYLNYLVYIPSEGSLILTFLNCT